MKNQRLFGAIQKLPSGNYRGRYRKDGKEYYTPTTKTKRETQNLLDITHAQILYGQWTPPKPNKTNNKPDTTCQTLATQFYKKLDTENASPNTKRSYRSTLNAHFLPAYGNTPPKEVTQENIQDLLDQLKTSYAPASVVNIRRTLNTFFNYAKECALIETNPVEGVKTPSLARNKPKHTPTALTASELNKLLDTVPEELRLFFALGSWCALRYSEIACLTVTDINIRDWTVSVSKGVKRDVGGALVVGVPKSRAGYRVITIPPRIRPIVEKHLSHYVDASGLLFHNPENPYGFYSDRFIRRILADSLGSLGLPVMRFHDLRHTGLTLYGQAGATLADLMYRAGHSSPDTVMIYQRATLDRDRELTERMGR